VLRHTANLDFNFSDVDFQRTREAYADICVALTESALSFDRPLLTHAAGAIYAGPGMPLASLATLSGYDWITFLYGPRFFNHTCLAYVELLGGVLDTIQHTSSYEDYRTGHFFDCALQEFRNAGDVAAADAMELLKILPAWRTCYVVPTENDDEGLPKLSGYPRIKCLESAFNLELGNMLASPFKARAFGVF
jgi:hypothetical protein